MLNMKPGVKHMAKREIRTLGDLIPFAGQANGCLTI